MENFHVPRFHEGVQFAKVETRIHAHLLPRLPPLVGFLWPCDALLDIYLDIFNKCIQ